MPENNISVKLIIAQSKSIIVTVEIEVTKSPDFDT